MEIKKTIKPEIRLDSKKRILIVNVADTVPTHSTLPPIGKADKIMKHTHNVRDVRLKRVIGVGVRYGRKARFGRTVTIPTYQFSKKASALITKETGIHIPASIIQDKVLGVYPPVGSVIINGKHIKINAKNGRK